MTLPLIGDPVMCVYVNNLSWGPPHGTFVRTGAVEDSIRISVAYSHGFWVRGIPHVFKHSDEGRTWIRGHCDADSEEVKALLSAFALSSRL